MVRTARDVVFARGAIVPTRDDVVAKALVVGSASLVVHFHET
jgi:hypothetical protein